MTTNQHTAGTHADALAALAAAGFRATLTNTGGGCMAYMIRLEAGRHVLVVGIDDVFGRELTSSDYGWSAGVYCTACGDDHDQYESHGNASTDASTRDALVSTVRDAIRRDARR